MLGKYFQSLNSLEFIANQFTQSLFGETTLFDLPDVIRSITLNDVRSAAKVFIDQKHSVGFTCYQLKLTD